MHGGPNSSTVKHRRSKIPHEWQLSLLAAFGGLPAVAAALYFLWSGDFSGRFQWTLTILITGFWLGFAFSIREKTVYPLRTLSNLLAALREGDYTMRAREEPTDALGEVMYEVSMMGEMLREQRLGAIEAGKLLGTVMEEIDVAVFAFDGQQRLRLVKRAGERLLAEPSERLLERKAEQLGLADCLDGPPSRTLERTFPAGSGRWGVRRSSFREHGMPHQLLVVADLTRELREEELKAWQRLVRVLGHELNNSLAPIKSIASSLNDSLKRSPHTKDQKEDMRQGLQVIATRAEGLSQFMSSYATLAKLPAPSLGPVEVPEWVSRVAKLEIRQPVEITGGPELTVQADRDQLDQLLINLVRNAADAASETSGSVRVGWRRNHSQLVVSVQDDGLGLSSDVNLFVPFFTTKQEGSGIGLVLCRRIAENHGGSLTLRNRTDGSGCEAELRLPLEPLVPG